jgi:hypothetical protein
VIDKKVKKMPKSIDTISKEDYLLAHEDFLPKIPLRKPQLGI